MSISKVALNPADLLLKNSRKAYPNPLASKINAYVVLGSLLVSSAIVLAALGSFSLAGVSIGIASTTANLLIKIAAPSLVFGTIFLAKGSYDMHYKVKNLDAKRFGVAGIQNRGNNCWLNSLMQILLNSSVVNTVRENRLFNDFFLRYRASLADSELADSTRLRSYFSSKSHEISSGTRFEDLHGPLTSILDDLRSKDRELRNMITTKFHYKYDDSSRREVSEKREANNGILNLPMFTEKRKISLSKLLKDFFISKQDSRADVIEKTEITTQEPFLFGLFSRTKKTKEDVLVERRKLLLEERKLAFAPKDLFINIQRYVCSGRFDQEDKIVDVPMNLNMSGSYFDTGTKANYELLGFARNLNQIHYISYVKKAGIWFKCNDEHVEAISDHEAKLAAQKAYIVHYNKL
ncbi:MAG: hypothetical protein JXA94_05245 [Parachlamydiales bacterium]|nr:hypothetical protein [Parachlamydiales bacterium]